jgi:N-dimethylarginine dimethylaminohydrolase
VGGAIVSDTAQSDVGAITRVLVKHARDAFGSTGAIDAQWQALSFTAPPDFDAAVRQYDRFLEVLSGASASLHYLPPAPDVGLDSIYVRDASVTCDRGVILCRMGKPLREHEPDAQGAVLRELGLPVIGSITPPGRLEGGDVLWLDRRTVAVGRGYRTNDAGIAQLRALMADSVDELIVVPLPHWRGPGDVFHLMSMISPIDRDLAVVYSPLLPVPFREALLDRGTALVEVPDDEFESMGANVLAIAPRRCVMVAGNPITRRRLERAGADGREYDGEDISRKAGGGPTCLTRPLSRLDHRADL